jgi:hypothetical protein
MRCVLTGWINMKGIILSREVIFSLDENTAHIITSFGRT